MSSTENQIKSSYKTFKNLLELERKQGIEKYLNKLSPTATTLYKKSSKN